MADMQITLHEGDTEKTYDLEFGDLELQEVEEVEEAFGMPLHEIDFSFAKGAAFLIYWVKRRENAKFTLEDARKLKLSDLGEAPKENGKRPTRAKKPAASKA